MGITLEGLSLCYHSKKKGDVLALDHIDASFPSSSFSVVLGPSGCGKSTLLKAVAGLLDYQGEIYLDDKPLKDIPLDKAGLAYLPQQIHLYPYWTVFDNIAFPLKVRKTPRDELLGRVREIAEELGISFCLNVRPKFLSEGQRQRAMLARELVANAKTILFDEPLSSLDPVARKEICSLLKNYQKKHGTTFLYVTHSYTESMMLADRLFLMEKGRIVSSDTPFHLLNQANPYLRAMEESEKMEVLQ